MDMHEEILLKLVSESECLQVGTTYWSFCICTLDPLEKTFVLSVIKWATRMLVRLALDSSLL